MHNTQFENFKDVAKAPFSFIPTINPNLCIFASLSKKIVYGFYPF